MAYYKDLTQYQIEPRKLIGEKNFENVLNIGWLGEDGNFTKGEVSEEFLMNLWEYYRYPVYMKRKLYNNEGLDGYWKFFTAMYNGRRIQLGHSEIRVMNKKKDKIYAAPELILHYIMNHRYLPPQEFIDAVMTGPKPDSEEFCEMIRKTFVNVRKLECQKEVCPYCKSGYAYHVYREKREYESSEKLIVVDSDTLPLERSGEKGEYRYYQLCHNCGRLSEYEVLR